MPPALPAGAGRDSHLFEQQLDGGSNESGAEGTDQTEKPRLPVCSNRPRTLSLIRNFVAWSSKLTTFTCDAEVWAIARAAAKAVSTPTGSSITSVWRKGLAGRTENVLRVSRQPQVDPYVLRCGDRRPRTQSRRSINELIAPHRRFRARDDQLLGLGVLIALFCGALVAGQMRGSPVGSGDFSTSGFRRGCQRRIGRSVGTTMNWDLRHRKSSLVIRLLLAVWIAVIVVVLCATGRWWGLVFVVPLVLDLYLLRGILAAGSSR
jgi:hypothetical protein